MDIMSLIRTGSGMAWNAFLGDFIHDFIEKKRDGNKSPPQGGDASQTSNQNDKVKPFLGLAVLSHEEEYKFSRLWQKLNDDQKANLSAFLLEYYLKPAQTGGLLAKGASWWLYDQFMLLTVNRNSSGRQTGTSKITVTTLTDTPRTDRTANRSAFQSGGKQKVVDVNRSSTTGGSKTTTTNERSEEHHTPGGTEALAFLVELANIYEIGGVKPAEEYLRLHKMPLMDAQWLAKADAFIKVIPTKIVGLASEARPAIDALRARDEAIQQEQSERGFFSRLLNNI